MQKCANCNGSGTVIISVYCPECKGTGEVITFEDDGTETLEACTYCEQGLIYKDEQCHICRGTGQI